MAPPPLPGGGAGTGVKRSAAQELEDDVEEDEDADGMQLDNGASAVGFVPEGGVRPAEELDEDEVEAVDMSGYTDVGVVARLHKGRKLKEVLAVSRCQRRLDE
jgi:U4/U6 small nuclear ribonucleoprotein PRP31